MYRRRWSSNTDCQDTSEHEVPNGLGMPVCVHRRILAMCSWSQSSSDFQFLSILPQLAERPRLLGGSSRSFAR